MTTLPTQSPDQARAMESVLRFWAQAGVDTLYEDEPVNRLVQKARPAPPSPSPSPLASAPILPMRAAAPDVALAAAEARELAGACSTLEELAAAIAAFDGCGLKTQGARQAVFSRGDPRAPVMIIGEGPGADEDRIGEPFVGKAGQLLDRMLAAAGLEGRVFVTNTVFWRPPGNRTPTAAEQAACRPFVDRAVQLVSPRFLLLVGAASAKSMLASDEGVMSLRGRWFEWTVPTGRETSEAVVIPALPTLHPAFLLRQPAQKKKAWSDLMTLAERVDRPVRAP